MLRMAYVNIGRVDENSVKSFLQIYLLYNPIFKAEPLTNNTLLSRTQKWFTWEAPLLASLLLKLVSKKVGDLTIATSFIPPEGSLHESNVVFSYLKITDVSQEKTKEGERHRPFCCSGDHVKHVTLEWQRKKRIILWHFIWMIQNFSQTEDP